MWDSSHSTQHFPTAMKVWEVWEWDKRCGKSNLATRTEMVCEEGVGRMSFLSLWLSHVMFGASSTYYSNDLLLRYNQAQVICTEAAHPQPLYHLNKAQNPWNQKEWKPVNWENNRAALESDPIPRRILRLRKYFR